MTKLEKWKILNSKLVLNRNWYRVRQDQVELSNGQVVNDYFIKISPDTALVFPVTKDRQVVFVRQYRHGVGENVLELPAGAFYPQQEDSETAAARELAEETGYFAQELVKLATLYNSPGKDTNKIHLFLAEEVSQTGKQKLDLTEEIEVVLIPISAVQEKIYTGEICVSGTISAVFLGINFISKRANF